MNNQKVNLFQAPDGYIQHIIKNVRVPEEKREFCSGKAIASVFLTQFCDAGCAHCFFKSGKDKVMNPQEQCELSDYGLERMIEFINASNMGYLLIIGGGEPFQKLPHVMAITKRVKTDRLVLVTNGMWGQTYDRAKEIIFDLYEAYKQRDTRTKLVLRISVDKWHVQQLGYELVENIIDVFKEFFRDETDFELQLHSLIGDNSLNEIQSRRKDFKIVQSQARGISDNEQVLKISPHRCKMIFDDGYFIDVGLARTFYSTLKPNLNNPTETVKKAMEIFDDDMKNSIFDNPSIIMNKNGSRGHNLWVNYNGNVCLWGNQQQTDLYNLYVDDYDKFIRGSYQNVISYSFLQKGYTYRVGIINEVNPKAVMRSTAINIRDFAGASILEEKRTVLYYAIRAIQDYLRDGILQQRDLGDLPAELFDAIKLERDGLIRMYAESGYTILKEYMDRTKFDENDWKDLFTLIGLGHYDVTEQQIQEAMQYYNQHATTQISSITEVFQTSREHYERLTRRLTYMKPEAMEWCIQHK